MRVTIDEQRCTGALNCVDLAPGAFRAGPNGKGVVADVSSVDVIQLREASDNCPTGAIAVEPDEDVEK